MDTTRRQFLKMLSVGGFYTLASRAQAASPRRLIVVLLRGGVDGLHAIVPRKDKNYFRARPDLAIRNPLPLDDHFGLHPSMEPLIKLYRDSILAPVVAVGSPSLTRSHFDAQDFYESGTPDLKSTADGWMNRYLQTRPEQEQSPWRAVALGNSMPRILSGAAPVLASSGKLGIRGRKGRRLEDAFAAMYADTPGELGEAGRGALEAADDAREKEDGMDVSRGAPAAKATQRLETLGKIAASEEAFELGFVDLGGWDTHVNQGGESGQLARHLEDLALGLTRLLEELGPKVKETVVVVQTEFGRTVAQNGNGGTDHGHASIALVLGGPVRGGQVFGRWPGLASGVLHEGRDVQVTTDFRQLLAEVMSEHMRCRELEKLFPAWKAKTEDWLGIIQT